MTDDADAAAQTDATGQIPNIGKGPAREDSKTVSSRTSFEDIPSDKTSNERTSPKAGAKGKEKAKVTDDEQHNDNSTKDAASRLEEHVGDLFSAPDNSVLIHACNTQGVWGAGIAKEFHKRYPKAFKEYERHCLSAHHPKQNPVRVGTCLLIGPREVKPGAPKHWIGCLFTSAGHGRKKDPSPMILQNTVPAFKDLLDKLSREPQLTEIRMCQINSVLFEVPWKATRKVLQKVLAADAGHRKVHVYSLPAAPKGSIRSFVREH
ncbi:ADP-ribose 1''-phosphate phosphatase [Didymosphaeria variabile]|uniref:ADP-ribose 1''-phosphate phosphatase n=1 Tax=Didymosphaeria variabile TaxID=1932322 RepID=A0A9W8XJQ5_9PLEO|nr:ADP-ribose 1''-phosphate phosphatase [Didymosphaeria variabile]KAJ4352414.1 ADP-ribose 1''-phosphate phosphatase [Didymosphaeria variabile]